MKEEKLNHIGEIKSLIANGKTDKALAKLLRLLDDESNFPKRIKEESLLLAHRHSYFLRRKRLGLIDDTLEVNRVNSEILNLLEEVRYFYQNNNTDRLSDNLSELRKRQFLAKSLHELKIILFEAQRLNKEYPDRYELIRLIEDIENAIEYEIRRVEMPGGDECVYIPSQSKPPISRPKLLLRKRVVFVILLIILLIILVAYFVSR